MGLLQYQAKSELEPELLVTQQTRLIYFSQDHSQQDLKELANSVK
jgi:hypothetical protein